MQSNGDIISMLYAEFDGIKEKLMEQFESYFVLEELWSNAELISDTIKVLVSFFYSHTTTGDSWWWSFNVNYDMHVIPDLHVAYVSQINCSTCYAIIAPEVLYILIVIDEESSIIR